MTTNLCGNGIIASKGLDPSVYVFTVYAAGRGVKCGEDSTFTDASQRMPAAIPPTIARARECAVLARFFMADIIPFLPRSVLAFAAVNGLVVSQLFNFSTGVAHPAPPNLSTFQPFNLSGAAQTAAESSNIHPSIYSETYTDPFIPDKVGAAIRPTTFT